MSLRNKISKAVDAVFVKIGDLAVDATFTNKTVTDFNFSSGEVVSATATLVKKVVVEEKINRSQEQPTVVTTLMTKSTGEDFSVYTTVTVNSVVYNIISIADDGFLVNATITRSV